MELTDMQLDGLREIANIGSGTAATALSSMLGRTVDLTVPRRSALAAGRRGRRGRRPRGRGHRRRRSASSATWTQRVVLLFDPDQRGHGVRASSASIRTDPEMALSALGEIGNILGSSYVGAHGPDGRPRARAAAAGRARRHARRDRRVRPGRRPRWTPTSRCCSTPRCWSRAPSAASACCSSPTRNGVGRLLTGLGLGSRRRSRGRADGPHGRDRRVPARRRRARRPRPGLVHRPGAARPRRRRSPAWRTSCCRSRATGTTVPGEVRRHRRPRAAATR